jgi:SMI1 / KNR4 family (SUKH-1)
MDESQRELLQRVRERCHQRHWYGPDMEEPLRFYDMSEDTNASWFPLQTEFGYPPATQEQLAVSEEVLGYTLPPLLRALYATIANGGFGPGYGLYGVLGGFQNRIEPQVHQDADLINQEHDRNEQGSARQIDLWMYGSLEYREIPFEAWPKGLYMLCDWGCGIYSYLDCVSGRIYRGEAGDDVYILCCEATSLDEWLALWANGIDLWSKFLVETLSSQREGHFLF